MIRNLFGGSKCRTIDVCDIFGDGSGKALYRLDGNANDESGNYHGTETAITYGGGVYERGAVFNGSSSYVSNASLPQLGAYNSISLWFKATAFSTAGVATWSNGTNRVDAWVNTNQIQVKYNATWYSATVTMVTTAWYHLSVCIVNGIPLVYLNGNSLALTSSGGTAYAFTQGIEIGRATTASSYYFNGSIDQVRIFNRAITATEVATLYAECAPTSTVTDVNPFLDNSMKALYRFENNANDDTGVYNGTATNVTYGTGKFGQCVVFNGSAKIQNGSSINVTNDITISTWVKTTSTVSSHNVVGICETTSKLLGIRIDTGNTIRIEYGLSTPTTNNVIVTQASFPSISNGSWHHIVLSKNNGTLSLYVNGAYYTLSAYGTGNGSVVQGINIGCSPYSSTANFNGLIDQVRIFNKALTPMKVASLYCETTPLEEPMRALVDPFKDGSGKALYRLEGNALDESGNYNGTATGVTYGNGLYGRCGVFNGTTSNITTSVPAIGNDFSISVWIKTNQLSPSPFSAITNGSSATNPYSYTLYQYPNGAINFQDSHSSGSALVTANNIITSTSSWYHIVVTKVGTARKIYVNGALIASDNAGTSTVAQPSGIMIGKYYNQSVTPYTFNGLIDQLRFFNKELTLTEVQKLYTGENNVL